MGLVRQKATCSRGIRPENQMAGNKIIEKTVLYLHRVAYHVFYFPIEKRNIDFKTKF